MATKHVKKKHKKTPIVKTGHNRFTRLVEEYQSDAILANKELVSNIRSPEATPRDEEPTSSMRPLDTVLEDLAKKGQALAQHLVEESSPQEAVQVLGSLWQVVGSVPDPEEVITGLSILSWNTIGAAVEAGDIDLALLINARLLEACEDWPNDMSLHEATAGITAQLVATCASNNRLHSALDLFDGLWRLVQDSVSSGNKADRNKVLYASFTLAQAQQKKGLQDEAKTALDRVLSAAPPGESFAYLRATFGDEQVDGLLEELGYAHPNEGDTGER